MDKKFIKLIKSADRRALAQAITLLESTLKEDREQAEQLLSLLPVGKGSKCIGITGAPGVGKSTFIEAFGLYLAELGKKVGVLAVDPSSPLAGGAILADKTRMTRLSRHANAFVRPSASGAGFMGGLTSTTGDVIAVLEGAGFDIIIVETIGVGQNETAVRDFVDQLIYLVSPSSGDELQAIKKGITEVADLIVVTKDDQDMRLAAEQTAISYASLRREIPVLKCSSQDGRGIPEVWHELEKRLQHTAADRQSKQHLRHFHDQLQKEVMATFLNNPEVQKIYPTILSHVRKSDLTPREAVERLVNLGMRGK
jgi:LAO/AO transport system kinase